ncbi:MFS transporter [Companilactobacillus bobalius]|uniref:Multidrug resistance protein n=2 Tax=Companilactobacillus bobalius TaxID=2801451 RepID=A0A202FDT4_9LACO|nr:MFS transporter [Companilactobacillus bobalius]KAE9556971.1 MFS transporter [Companilactobacillus bobalius]KRK81893.1 MFS family major facilitator transporter [Companilactobacillus bobalius DSM 19674]OVE98626.1 Multidrug resistance protein [Companilactobacillus bobalius]GEO59049.1 MFS transporter [Companilactobacillus paralimentarius]
MKQNDTYKSKDILLVIGLFLVVFVIGADSFIISPLLPAIEKDYAVTTSQAALAVTIYALCYAVGSPFFGPLGDKFNKRKLLITGLLIFLIGSFICAQATNIGIFYFGRAVAGIGAAVTMPNVWATVGSYFTGKKLNIVMGITMSALSLSIAIGVPLGTLLSQLSNWHMAFWGSIILTLMAFGVLLLVVPSLKGNQGKLKYLASFQTLVKSRRALLSLSINLVWMFGFYLIYTFLGTFLNQNFHFNTAQTGNIFIVYGLSNFIASFCGGHLLSKLGAMKDVIINGFLSMIFILGLVIWQNQLWGIIIFLILLALVQGLGVTALTTYIVGVVPDKRSTVMSFNSSFLYLGLTLGSLIGAILYSKIGFTGLGIISIMALGIAIIETIRLKK